MTSVEFSTETLQDGRHWQETFKEVKSKDLLYRAKLSLKIERQINLPCEKKVKEFITTKPVL